MPTSLAHRSALQMERNPYLALGGYDPAIDLTIASLARGTAVKPTELARWCHHATHCERPHMDKTMPDKIGCSPEANIGSQNYIAVAILILIVATILRLIFLGDFRPPRSRLDLVPTISAGVVWGDAMSEIWAQPLGVQLAFACLSIFVLLGVIAWGV